MKLSKFILEDLRHQFEHYIMKHPEFDFDCDVHVTIKSSEMNILPKEEHLFNENYSPVYKKELRYLGNFCGFNFWITNKPQATISLVKNGIEIYEIPRYDIPGLDAYQTISRLESQIKSINEDILILKNILGEK